MEKTVLTFYVDDTNPYVAPPEAFKTFLDFVDAEGAAGESSLILGYDWAGHGHLDRPDVINPGPYIEQVRRAFSCGIDTQFELYTHQGLFDFSTGRVPEGAIHEGLWMYEPAVTEPEYEDYFSHILAEGDRLGVRFTGLTWPGCGCPACQSRYQELREQGITEPNPNVWQALLTLVKAGRFRSRTVPCFIGSAQETAVAQRMAGEGSHAVFSLPANAGDQFGKWMNDPAHVNPDYYITADGQAGRIVDLVRARVPYCLFYTHWQGVNPANGVGWEAFTQVIRRVERYLREQVTWMRPSQYTDGLVGSRPENG